MLHELRPRLALRLEMRLGDDTVTALKASLRHRGTSNITMRNAFGDVVTCSLLAFSIQAAFLSLCVELEIKGGFISSLRHCLSSTLLL